MRHDSIHVFDTNRLNDTSSMSRVEAERQLKFSAALLVILSLATLTAAASARWSATEPAAQTASYISTSIR